MARLQDNIYSEFPSLTKVHYDPTGHIHFISTIPVSVNHMCLMNVGVAEQLFFSTHLYIEYVNCIYNYGQLGYKSAINAGK